MCERLCCGLGLIASLKVLLMALFKKVYMQSMPLARLAAHEVYRLVWIKMRAWPEFDHLSMRQKWVSVRPCQ